MLFEPSQHADVRKAARRTATERKGDTLARGNGLLRIGDGSAAADHECGSEPSQPGEHAL